MTQATRVSRLVVLAGLLMILAALLLGGCSVVPDRVNAEWEHTSHPFAGWPFGPQNEEDTLDTINVIGRWQRGALYTELGVGYRISDGGFYGPELTGTARIGVELWSRGERAR